MARIRSKKNLRDMIEAYLFGNCSYEDLSSYAWATISSFEKNADTLSQYSEDIEGVFWYAIWQFQHLASEDHEKDGSLKAELLQILDYLNNKKVLPKKFYGKRP